MTANGDHDGPPRLPPPPLGDDGAVRERQRFPWGSAAGLWALSALLSLLVFAVLEPYWAASRYPWPHDLLDWVAGTFPPELLLIGPAIIAAAAFSIEMSAHGQLVPRGAVLLTVGAGVVAAATATLAWVVESFCASGGRSVAWQFLRPEGVGLALALAAGLGWFSGWLGGRLRQR